MFCKVFFSCKKKRIDVNQYFRLALFHLLENEDCNRHSRTFYTCTKLFFGWNRHNRKEEKIFYGINTQTHTHTSTHKLLSNCWWLLVKTYKHNQNCITFNNYLTLCVYGIVKSQPIYQQFLSIWKNLTKWRFQSPCAIVISTTILSWCQKINNYWFWEIFQPKCWFVI